MYATLYKNKWPVLAFVVLVLAGAQYFFGSGWGDEFVPNNSPAAPVAQEGDGDNSLANSDAPTELTPDQEAFYDDDSAFLSDEELIDNAEGFDPTPVEEVNNVEEDYASDPTIDDRGRQGEPSRPMGNVDYSEEQPTPEELGHN